ncbi:hypothetical protein K491DRAFT_107257 [Lophiostoma macrostomum CBS 122681]|uniref:Uncharacterized protein n=1 Tax=Lophiostoma macrostomum CBS 122681 TaxID=1314788 RepID=A0A6A6TJG4_9PLEO|nr:hypothetical protein K491DRAFT_107257 [Lophiostoma macrostomum CBS 122681]
MEKVSVIAIPSASASLAVKASQSSSLAISSALSSSRAVPLVSSALLTLSELCLRTQIQRSNEMRTNGRGSQYRTRSPYSSAHTPVRGQQASSAFAKRCTALYRVFYSVTASLIE